MQLLLPCAAAALPHTHRPPAGLAADVHLPAVLQHPGEPCLWKPHCQPVERNPLLHAQPMSLFYAALSASHGPAFPICTPLALFSGVASCRLQALKPTLFIGVPRVFDKVYDGVQARLKQAPLRKRLIFALALWYKWRNIKAGYRWDEVRTSSPS